MTSTQVASRPCHLPGPGPCTAAMDALVFYSLAFLILHLVCWCAGGYITQRFLQTSPGILELQVRPPHVQMRAC